MSMEKSIICTYCQKQIVSNPSYEFVRISKGKRLLIFPKTIRQVFPFCTRGDLLLWLRAGQTTRSGGND